MVRLSAVGTALLITLLLVTCSCGPKQEPRPNVVLIVIDTLRPDHLPFYGYEKNTAPFLATLAAEGVVFERVHSTSSWTAPATASIVTSLHPVQHGVHTGFVAAKLLGRIDPTIAVNRIPDAVETAAEAFAKAGYATWGVSDNINVSPAEGFEQGFTNFRHFEDLGAQGVNAVVRGWAKDLESSRPYFLYLHYMDPHRPYLRHAPWYSAGGTELLDSVSAYDSEISYVDGFVKELYELLAWDRNTVLAIVSDHGEEFLEHGGWDHGRTLYAEVLNVPLVFCSSAAVVPARRVAERVSVLDVLPTLLDAAGLPASPAHEGRSLLPAITGDAAPPLDRDFFADLRSAPWFGCRVLKAVVRGDEKCVFTLPDGVELYDLAADPWEQRSLADGRDDVVADLRSRLDRFEAGCARYAQETTPVVLDAQTLEKLRSLGYAN